MTDVKPCELPCTKCGGADVHRQYFRGGEHVPNDVRQYGVAPFDRAWLSGDGYYFTAARELIAHTCRTCGHAWPTKPLKKPKRRAVNEEDSREGT